MKNAGQMALTGMACKLEDDHIPVAVFALGDDGAFAFVYYGIDAEALRLLCLGAANRLAKHGAGQTIQ